MEKKLQEILEKCLFAFSELLAETALDVRKPKGIHSLVLCTAPA